MATAAEMEDLQAALLAGLTVELQRGPGPGYEWVARLVGRDGTLMFEVGVTAAQAIILVKDGATEETR